MNMSRLFLIFLLLGGTAIAFKSTWKAHTPLSHVMLYGLNEPVSITTEAGTRADIEPANPARVCVRASGGSGGCFEAKSNESSFPLEPETVLVRFPSRGSKRAILFSSHEDFSGSGTATFVSVLIWTGTLTNVLPTTVLSNQSDYHVWNAPSTSMFPIITVADFVLSPDESHFGRHHYRVKTFVFEQQSRTYSLRDEYVTKAKYAVIDTPKKDHVVQAELSRIKARLARR